METEISRQVDQVKSKIKEALAFDVQHLRRPDLGQYLSFEVASGTFEAIQRTVMALDKADLTLVPLSRLRHLASALTTIQDLYANRILKWNPNMDPTEPMKVRDARKDELERCHDELYLAASGVLAIANTLARNQELAEIEARMESRARAMDEWVVKAETSAQKIESIALAATDSAEKFGIAKHAEIFRDSSAQHSEAAKQWLWATGLGAAVLALAAMYFVFLLPPLDARGIKDEIQLSAHRFNLVQRGMAKLLLFSTLFTVVIWCGRTYRVHRHNEVVNRHRANALSTFRIFAETQIDQSTRDAVLLQSTQCIFAPQPSGYIHGEQEAHPSSQVLEVIRGIGSK